MSLSTTSTCLLNTSRDDDSIMSLDILLVSLNFCFGLVWFILGFAGAALRFVFWLVVFFQLKTLEGLIMQTPKVLIHPYVCILVFLFNITGILWALWNLVSLWHKRRQFLGEEYALK